MHQSKFALSAHAFRMQAWQLLVLASAKAGEWSQLVRVPQIAADVERVAQHAALRAGEMFGAACDAMPALAVPNVMAIPDFVANLPIAAEHVHVGAGFAAGVVLGAVAAYGNEHRRKRQRLMVAEVPPVQQQQVAAEQAPAEQAPAEQAPAEQAPRPTPLRASWSVAATTEPAAATPWAQVPQQHQIKPTSSARAASPSRRFKTQPIMCDQSERGTAPGFKRRATVYSDDESDSDSGDENVVPRTQPVSMVPGSRNYPINLV
jgi:hypothetical protein